MLKVTKDFLFDFVVIIIPILWIRFSQFSYRFCIPLHGPRNRNWRADPSALPPYAQAQSCWSGSRKCRYGYKYCGIIRRICLMACSIAALALSTASPTYCPLIMQSGGIFMGYQRFFATCLVLVLVLFESLPSLAMGFPAYYKVEFALLRFQVSIRVFWSLVAES